ncbi:MAG: hypothetical protein M5U19_08760 [Microthrixaceae bacterium]|nr:hypothetical protein [Microthrixaceae bacterium]
MASLREKGWVRPEQLPRIMEGVTGSELRPDEPFVAMSRHVHEGVPYSTPDRPSAVLHRPPLVPGSRRAAPLSQGASTRGWRLPAADHRRASPLEHPRIQQLVAHDARDHQGRPHGAPQRRRRGRKGGSATVR